MTAYFSTLNYTLANEDSALEHDMVPEGASHVMCIAGSGSRSLAILDRAPKRLTCVDMVKEQLLLTELRMATVRQLRLEEFLGFWGYPGATMAPERRKELFSSLKVSAEAQRFFLALFGERGWSDILYAGRWEQTIKKVAKVAAFLIRERGLRIFETRTIEEQRDYFLSKFPMESLNLAIFMLGNSAFFNSVLYKGHFPKKNIPESFYGFYRKAFYRLFTESLTRENFFLQLFFHGKLITREACPVECFEPAFSRIKANLENCEVVFVQGDISKCARETKVPVSQLFLSDVPSYFAGEVERNFLQDLKPCLEKKGQVVVRSYLHVPEGTDTTGYTNVKARYRDVIDREKTQVYIVDVFEKT